MSRAQPMDERAPLPEAVYAVPRGRVLLLAPHHDDDIIGAGGTAALHAEAGDPVRVTFQLLDYDHKRMHYFEQLFHATEGWVSATSENMSLHVDMAAGKTAPFPPDVARCLEKMKASHAKLPLPEAVGRQIMMPGKS